MNHECSMCILDDGIPGVKILDDGLCNFCHWNTNMILQYPTGDEGNKILNKTISEIKTENKNNRYDAVIGVSGGVDSSFLLVKMACMGLRLLAVHFDNNWNTDVAIDNILALTDKYSVDLKIRKIGKDIYDALCKSFLLASVPDADVPNDIALATVLYEEAEKENVNCIINGHSFRTEGTCPVGWTYMDGKYIQSINNSFLKTDISSFPNMTLHKWINWLSIKRIRPLYYINYDRQDAKQSLKKCGWKDYNGLHAENKYTKFVGNYLWKKKFNQDLRYVSYSAQIRNGLMSKKEARYYIKKPQHCETSIIEEVKDRLGISGSQWHQILNAPIKSYLDYETYDFSKLSQLFDEYRDVLPQTFIDKYVDKRV